MKTQRILLAIALAASLQFARDVLADGDEDYTPQDKVQPAETDVDDDSDDSRELDVDDAGDPSREVDVDAAGDKSREVDVDDATEEGDDSEDGDD